MGQLNSSTAARDRTSSTNTASESQALAALGSPASSSELEAGGTADGTSSGSARRNAQATKRSRRESLRRSIVGLVKSDSTAASDDARAKNADSESRRRWRRSRVVSETPALHGAESQQIDTISESTVRPSDEDSPVGTADKTAAVASVDSSTMPDEVSIPRQTADVVVAGPPTHDATPSRAILESAPLINSAASSTAGQSSSSAHTQETRPSTDEMMNDVVDAGTADGDDHDRSSGREPGAGAHPFPTNVIESVLDPSEADEHMDPLGDASVLEGLEGILPPLPPPAESRSAPDQPQTARFPSGTLVVVQGVVHTTDASRAAPSNSSQPARNAETNAASSTPSATASPTSVSGAPSPSARAAPPSQRNALLSSILRHSPPSLHPRRTREAEDIIGLPRSADIPHPRQLFSRSEAVAEQQLPTSSSSSTAPSSSSSPASHSVPLTPSTSTLSSADGPSPGTGRPQLSSNSMDVLGALLSVATAATAASLLSGKVYSSFYLDSD